ncbi:hypothetical protein N7478_004195 [Penicillium angulare]|uniref:uncharacterized protein n=1 Tax=Penicillium angulare TaxID=116970 RepID=UPI00253FA8E8|nr:uncharacterized protein N7478_004195 [Penicillium angulare]KAJ5278823.1 hypothetical protein N7478_004195 [Penicillium angulare]
MPSIVVELVPRESVNIGGKDRSDNSKRKPWRLFPSSCGNTFKFVGIESWADYLNTYPDKQYKDLENFRIRIDSMRGSRRKGLFSDRGLVERPTKGDYKGYISDEDDQRSFEDDQESPEEDDAGE